MVAGTARVLCIGGGGREHAMVAALAKSSHVAKVYVAPGNGGTASMGGKVQNVTDLNVSKPHEIAAWAATRGITLAAIGPEAPLVAGAADALRTRGIATFGPSQAAAHIEASKAWSKAFMERHGLRTARFKAFSRQQLEDAIAWIRSASFDVVVKASGLAAGKGVLVPARGDKAAAEAAVFTLCSSSDSSSDEIVIEERLDGPEVSLLAWCDGSTCECMPPAQDHKRAHDGDRGLNTGGMGAYAPTPMISEPQLCEARAMMRKAVSGLEAEGRPFVGVLYGGFMLDPTLGPCLLEFNARFGDPETQVLLPLLKSDCFEVMRACAEGRLASVAPVRWREACAAAVVVAATGYPGAYEKGIAMSSLVDAEALPGVSIYHAGTQLRAGGLETSGGRVVAATAVAAELCGAVSAAYAAAARVRFKGAFFRGDVGRRCIDAKVRIGVLGSTRGTSLQPVLDAAKQHGELSAIADFICVLSNKPDAPILDRARVAGVPIVKYVSTVDRANNGQKKSRDAYDAELSRELDAAGVE